MHQKVVGETVQAIDCFSIIDRNRLLAQVALVITKALNPPPVRSR